MFLIAHESLLRAGHLHCNISEGDILVNPITKKSVLLSMEIHPLDEHGGVAKHILEVTLSSGLFS